MSRENSWGLPSENFPQQELRHLPVFAKELLAGGIAGGLSKTCVAPLERVKILFQTGKMVNSSVGQTLLQILRNEGVSGWYRGNGASVLRIVPYAAFNFSAYEKYRALLARYAYGSESLHHHIPPTLDLLAGSAAGGTAVLITYPLDLVRTRLAYGDEQGSSKTSGGGHPTPAAAPASANSKSRVEPSQQARTLSSQSASISGRPEAGHAAFGSRGFRGPLGAEHLGSGIPTAVQAPARNLRPTIRSVLALTIQREGIPGLYKGIYPTLLGIVPYAGLKFYIYQSMKQSFWKMKQPKEILQGDNANRRLPVWLMLTFGGFAGVVAQTVTYPLDVIRRHMQVQGLRGDAIGELRVKSTWGGLASIARQKGYKSLFAGLSINYLKVVPSTAIGFSVYDAAKQYLDLPQNL